MIRRSLFAVAVLLGGAAWLAAGIRHGRAARPVVDAPTTVLDERRFDYPEDEGTGRILAEIRAVLERRGGDAILRVTASACGPRIDPIPGWQGVRGANRITAEEIASLAAHDRLRVETDEAGAAPPMLGSARVGRCGRIPERRIGPDGSIDVLATTAADLPLELIAEAAPLGDGMRRTRLVVDGKPRLEVVTLVRGAEGRILEVRALDEHAPEKTP